MITTDSQAVEQTRLLSWRELATQSLGTYGDGHFYKLRWSRDPRRRFGTWRDAGGGKELRAGEFIKQKIPTNHVYAVPCH